MTTGETKIAGLIGFPARYSLSPTLHTAAYESLGIDATYVVFPVQPTALQSAVEGIRALEIMGASVTVPFKQYVIPFLDELDSSAAELNAVNTIVNHEGVLVGHNTDGLGFAASLETLGFEAFETKVAVIGAGGAASAVVGALAAIGADEICVVNRSVDRAQAITERYTSARVGNSEDIGTADLIVNATPVGMADNPGVPFDTDLLNANQVVIDLIYAPWETDLLKAANGLGCVTDNGMSMLVHQAAEQVQLWTGKQPSVEAMLMAAVRWPR